ncbi:hypothetical protein AOQ71_29710 [Bradyrhizobium manausense]|uniref:Uncharacterized protein n=2 Tax=Bradyrhizobium manausense TaxID=989370 RepID=A0A0R3DAV4_9BRAD|nr:hypothetical protein AOQ71_29710 [Bradyrhizobium manausense]
MILASSLLIALAGSVNAATVHHAHRHHIVRPDQGASDPASAFGYAPSGPAIYPRAAPYGEDYGMYPRDSQGYAPGEREQFLDSVRQGG